MPLVWIAASSANRRDRRVKKCLAPGTLVLVEWMDAFGVGGWHSAAEVREDDTQAIIRTVGWVVADKNDYLVLSMQVQIGLEYVGATASIPQSCINQITRLGAKYRARSIAE